MIRVVLDTNVVVSAVLSTLGPPLEIIELANQNLIQLCVSAVTFEEYREVLGRPQFARLKGLADLQLLELSSLCRFVIPRKRVRASTDKDDDVFLECAEAAKAYFLVTATFATSPTAGSTARLLRRGGELNADKLEKAGWAIIFGPSVSKKIRDNLSPLIELRRKQVGDPARFKDNLDAPAAKQSASDWLLANGTSLNVVDPLKGVPYYVMIVASPAEIPFEFQYELDLYWAVGRLWLENEDAYANYAESVVEYENPGHKVSTAKKMVLFAPDYAGQDNGAGKLLCDKLVKPMLAAGLGADSQFKTIAYMGADATKEKLGTLFSGADPGGPPALLFTGSHGLLKLPTSKELADAQGSIVCEPWTDPPPDTSYYAAWDLPKAPKVHGMVHFLFNCYGLGWPRNDTYSLDKKVEISPAPMMARLPQALLGCEGGALAVLGHIDRAWSWSYTADGETPQDQSFRDVLTKIMSGYRLGSATDQFNLRWATLAIPLKDTLKKMQTRRGLEQEAATLWMACDDARNYILHGDPAVKLRIEDMS